MSTYPREKGSEEGARECSGAYRRRGREPLERALVGWQGSRWRRGREDGDGVLAAGAHGLTRGGRKTGGGPGLSVTQRKKGS